MDGLTEGRIVHFVTPNGKHRPAIIVESWASVHEDGKVNLQVFLDGENDNQHNAHYFPVFVGNETGSASLSIPALTQWQTSVPHDPNGIAPRSWHWIEKA